VTRSASAADSGARLALPGLHTELVALDERAQERALIASLSEEAEAAASAISKLQVGYVVNFLLFCIQSLVSMHTIECCYVSLAPRPQSGGGRCARSLDERKYLWCRQPWRSKRVDTKPL
jgi:hypothetical protein